ncbi:proline--tRNA ligase, partial [Pseudomonas syringae]
DVTAAAVEVVLAEPAEQDAAVSTLAYRARVGIPNRLVGSDRGLDERNLEDKSRTESQPQAIAVADVLSFIQGKVNRWVKRRTC